MLKYNNTLINYKIVLNYIIYLNASLLARRDGLLDCITCIAALRNFEPEIVGLLTGSDLVGLTVVDFVSSAFFFSLVIKSAIDIILF